MGFRSNRRTFRTYSPLSSFKRANRAHFASQECDCSCRSCWRTSDWPKESAPKWALRDAYQYPAYSSSTYPATQLLAPSPNPKRNLTPGLLCQRGADWERRAAPANWADPTRGTVRLVDGAPALWPSAIRFVSSTDRCRNPARFDGPALRL